jgi:hypothetical protein
MPVDALLDQFNECEGTRSLDDLFNFRESEKSLIMDSRGGSFFISNLQGSKKVINQNQGECSFFKDLVPQA